MSFAKIRPRRGTASQWNNANPILAEGEIGIEVPSTGVGTGTVKIKFGDGSTHWNDLPYGVDTIGNNTDMISEKFMAGTPCVKDSYYIANDTLYKCLNNTDGSVDVSDTNYFKKTTVGAELSSEKSNKSFEVIATATANGNVTTIKPLHEFSGFMFSILGNDPDVHAVFPSAFGIREVFEMKNTILLSTNETGNYMGRVKRVNDNTVNFFGFKSVKNAYLIGFY